MSSAGNVARVFTRAVWFWCGVAYATLAAGLVLVAALYQARAPFLLVREAEWPDVVLRTIAGIAEPEALPWFKKASAGTSY